MTEFDPLSADTAVDPAVIDRNYAVSSANVRARFKLYEYVVFEGASTQDISEIAVDTLQAANMLPPQGTVADVGGADAALAEYLLVNKDHRGEVWVIEPNTRQFRDYDQLRFTLNDWQALKRTAPHLPLNFEAIETLVASGEVKPWGIGDNLILHPGRAQDLSFLADNSVDALFAMFMLYHVPTVERPTVFREFQRVVQPEGVVTIATSGARNKQEHRRLEHAVADRLGVEPPPAMNAGFTSEKAAAEIPVEYEHVYRFEQKGRIVIDSARKVRDYMRSLHSLRDQFQPVPTREDYDEAIVEVVLPFVRRDIKTGGAFYDYVHRSVFFASHVALELPPASGFESIG